MADKINVLAELERIGIEYEFAGTSEIKVKCPFHDDDSPSCHVNVDKQLFKCQAAGCEKAGDMLTLLARFLGTTRRVIFEELSKRYTFDETKIIDPEVIERYHNAIWDAGVLLQELYKRGMSDELIRKYRIGFNEGRITIPIKSESGLFVNVRKYLPGAPGADKMRNVKGHGGNRLYPIEQLKYSNIVICGGELKAIVAASLLNAHGIGAITATAGEDNWDTSFSDRFIGKRVWVLFDVDQGGRKAAETRCANLKSRTRFVGNVLLPLDIDKYPHGDINDWVGQENANDTDLVKLLECTEEWKSKITVTEDNGPAEELHLTQSVDAKYTGRRMRVAGVISAMDTAPYIIPKKCMVLCDRDQDMCAICPIFNITPDAEGIHYVEIPSESQAILEMVATPKAAQREALVHAIGVPTQCKVVEFKPTEFYNAEDVRISPQLEITSRTADRVMQPAICLGHGLELNEHYAFEGRMYPHPKTQQSTLLISSYKTQNDALSSYVPDRLDDLKVFQPEEWTLQGLIKKLDSIYDDLSANVTRIFKRQSLHLVIDLAYHSCLLYNFDGRVTKGWAEVLIVGDSAQGKSETTLRMMQHYGLGEKIECKNATVAGLLGGLQQMSSRWFVTWGVIPTHDRRLVVLEELKGTSTEVIAKLTDMRSSGIAEIPKIEKRRTHARTRLIALSNPRSDHTLSTYNFGIEAIKELIGGLEDIRRFDTALLVSAREIDHHELNKLQKHRPDTPHVHTSDLCRRLILWAWTRQPDEISFTDEARARVLDEATKLCDAFHESIPVVDRGSMRHKIGRLALALAARTFSSKGEHVIVRDCHVEYIAKFLFDTYSSSVFGYKDFSDAINIQNELLDPKVIKTQILQTPFPADFIKQLLHTNYIELRDLCDWCGWDKQDALQLLSLLVRKHALRRAGYAYRKVPSFIDMLKDMLESDELKAVARPDYIGEMLEF